MGGTYPFEQYSYSAITGNLSSNAGVSYAYNTQSPSCLAGALSKAHAVTSAGSNTYCYDRNVNMERRTLGGSEYNLTYDAENHLTGVSGPGVNVSFVYDGDGKRVKADWEGSPDHTIIAYIGNIYEYQKVGTTTTVRQYYYAGTTRVAMRTGSTARAANADGTPCTNCEQRYKPWGEKRYPTGASGLPTTYRYTGQRQEDYIKLYWYGSRWYDDYLNRWIQPDSIIPQATQGIIAWDRYAYANNSPTKYIDPTGHAACVDEDCKVVEHPRSGRLILRRGTPRYTTADKLLRELSKKGREIIQHDAEILESYSNNIIPGSAETWKKFATGFDTLAWFTDVYAVGVVTTGGIWGAGIPAALLPEGIPEVPLVTGLAGVGISELYVQPVLTIGNLLASAAMGSTIIADMKDASIPIETGTLNSIAITTVGWISREAYLSFIFQSVSCANDFGWISFPIPRH